MYTKLLGLERTWLKPILGSILRTFFYFPKVSTSTETWLVIANTCLFSLTCLLYP